MVAPSPGAAPAEAAVAVAVCAVATLEAGCDGELEAMVGCQMAANIVLARISTHSRASPPRLSGDSPGSFLDRRRQGNTHTLATHNGDIGAPTQCMRHGATSLNKRARSSLWDV